MDNLRIRKANLASEAHFLYTQANSKPYFVLLYHQIKTAGYVQSIPAIWNRNLFSLINRLIA